MTFPPRPGRSCTACGSPMLAQIAIGAASADVQSFKCPRCNRIQKYGAEPAADYFASPIPEVKLS